ncbi:RagB/SusD family nutrient uptake outer membrane protein [Pedobacter sp. PWIIR3]
MKTKYMKMICCVGLLACAGFISSCKKYLDEPPSKSSAIEVTSTQNLDALLENYTVMNNENQAWWRLFGTDDTRIDPEYMTTASFLYGLNTSYAFTWDRTFQETVENRDWTFNWGRVFTANLVLSALSKVKGTEEDKARLKAEAHFVRAVNYWILANTYCLPFTDANKNEPGLPLKLSSSFEEDLTRVPLFKIYEQIESDLQEALKITTPLVIGTTPRSWRANTAGVNAFAARYYLHRNNYQEAEKYATISLNLYSALVDYNTEMGFSTSQTNFPVTYGTVEIAWKETTWHRQATHNGMITPSTDLLDLFDKSNDWRYIYHVVENGGALYGITNPNLSYNQFGLSNLTSGTTVAETILTKAEALARLDRVTEAMTTVNLLRVKRLKPQNASVTPAIPSPLLTASTKPEAITKILQERRRELPFSMRWFDLRRLNHNEDPTDNKTITRQFYQLNGVSVQQTLPLVTYTLTPGSRKYALMIPRTEIIASGNKLVQNTY